ncbi:hypothetical protein [uncultured Lacinutrix sp.]|uniref:hypothetical protein n=1 Tax=uncultured Lacinutrix sp. TaxID=574032 RepID=UPI00263118A1|nr:hypothetical protein [uncultured Lacinutrix sp.]
MFNNLTYKQKFIAALALFLLLVMASYKKTFKHVIEAKKELANVESKLLNSENIHSELYAIKNDIRVLDNIIGGHTDNPEDVQRKLLNFIANIDINIVEIGDVHEFQDDKYLIYTNQIELEGSYNDLINALYTIEKDFKDSRVASVKIYSKKDYRTNTNKLYLKLILQNYAGKK